ncbi:uncharacterized protein [Onthophagus taurus]|uniref:uncharacterized protein n=1 Tax=Onthophagus taurus TaxID=166361 RepID=UPI0039BEC557
MDMAIVEIITKINTGDYHIIAKPNSTGQKFHSQVILIFLFLLTTAPEDELVFVASAGDIENTYRQFQLLHNQVIGLITEEEFDEHDRIRQRADSAYFSIKAIHQRIKDSHITEEPPTTLESPKLSKIMLPTFTGDFKAWPSFFDLFRSMVHENKSFSDVIKYQYLLMSLSGEPLQLIKGLPMTNDNYPIAFEMLKSRYQNKRHLATLYYNEIQGITIKQEGSAKAYRSLIDTFTENVEGLKTLGFPVDSWDFLLFNILLQKLDTSIKTKFEVEHCTFEIPTYSQLITFLESQAKALDSVKLTSSNSKNIKPNLTRQSKPNSASFATETKSKPSNFNCPLCNDVHNLYKCSKFHGRTPAQRFEFVTKTNLCKSCLGCRHSTSKCNSTNACRICNKRHHTLLHLNNPMNENTLTSNMPSQSPSNTTVGSALNSMMTVLLPVAELEVRDRFGTFHKVRALIDSCSMVNFITERLQRRLQLERCKSSVTIEGLNSMSSNCNGGSIACAIKPCNALQPILEFTAIISPKICSNQLKEPIELLNYPHLRHLNISVGQSSPGPVDLLLGAELVPLILTGARKIGTQNEPAALESIFGWLLIGKSNNSSVSTSNLTLFIEPTVDFCLQRFWELDQVKNAVAKSPENVLCEKHFNSTYHRNTEGRFVLALPFKDEQPSLGQSYQQAFPRFLFLEKWLLKNSTMYNAYQTFMEDYLSQQHMSPVPMTSAIPKPIVSRIITSYILARPKYASFSTHPPRPHQINL